MNGCFISKFGVSIHTGIFDGMLRLPVGIESAGDRIYALRRAPGD